MKTKTIIQIGLTIIIILSASFQSFTQTKTPPDLITYSFQSGASKLIKGTSTERPEPATIHESDKIGNVGVVSLWYQNYCYTDGRYNNNNYLIENGRVKSDDKSSGFDAYKIHEPKNKATGFLASKHCVYYKFPKKTDYTIYIFEDGKIEKIQEIKSNDIILDKYIKIDKLSISEIKGSKTFFAAPSNKPLSAFTKLSENVEGARVKKNKYFDINKYRYEMPGVPFDLKTDYNKITRQLFFIDSESNSVSFVWQGKKDLGIYLTKIEKNYTSHRTIKIAQTGKEILIAATNDKTDLYYLCVIRSNVNSDDDELFMYKTGFDGKIKIRKKLNTSKNELNVYRFENYTADLAYVDSKLALIIGRTMHKSSDGLNHQAAIACIYNTSDLNVLKKIGATSSHSFDNLLTINSDNKFIALDLGDNYPRGIHLHKFDEIKRKSRVVYTFKTQHGTRPGYNASMNYPKYPEISNSTTTYYKWSNDNGTYSELGGVVETNDAYAVIFSGEPDSNGKSINNSRVGENNQDSRNLGFLKVRKDFENAGGGGNVVSDDLILSKGISESSGFYTFGGRWSEQRNTGVIWLTDYKNRAKENVTHIKTAKLGDGKIMILWEKANKESYDFSYSGTFAMIIDKNGKKITEPIELGTYVRLNRRDEVLVKNNKVFIIQGNEVEKKIELSIIKLK